MISLLTIENQAPAAGRPTLLPTDSTTVGVGHSNFEKVDFSGSLDAAKSAANAHAGQAGVQDVQPQQPSAEYKTLTGMRGNGLLNEAKKADETEDEQTSDVADSGQVAINSADSSTLKSLLVYAALGEQVVAAQMVPLQTVAIDSVETPKASSSELQPIEQILPTVAKAGDPSQTQANPVLVWADIETIQDVNNLYSRVTSSAEAGQAAAGSSLLDTSKGDASEGKIEHRKAAANNNLSMLPETPMSGNLSGIEKTEPSIRTVLASQITSSVPGADNSLVTKTVAQVATQGDGTKAVSSMQVTLKTETSIEAPLDITVANQAGSKMAMEFSAGRKTRTESLNTVTKLETNKNPNADAAVILRSVDTRKFMVEASVNGGSTGMFDDEGSSEKPLSETANETSGQSVAPVADRTFRIDAPQTSKASATFDVELPKKVIDQIVREVRVAQSPGRSDLVVRLTPPELGVLHVHITQDASGIATRIVASCDQVRSLLQNHAQALVSALADAGVKSESLTVTTDNRSTFDTPGRQSGFTGNNNRPDDSRARGNQQWLGRGTPAFAAAAAAMAASSTAGPLGYSWLA